MIPPPNIEYIVYIKDFDSWLEHARWGTYDAARDDAIDTYGQTNNPVFVCESKLLFNLGVTN